MKKIFLILILSFYSNLYSIELKEITVDERCRLSDLQFFNEHYGIATSFYGNYYITTNNGENWKSKYAGTDEYLHGCFILNKNNIWIYGAKGTLIKLDSIDAKFQDYSISPIFKIKNVYFWDENNGILLPEAEFYFITEDGGKNWIKKSLDLKELVRFDSYAIDRDKNIYFVINNSNDNDGDVSSYLYFSKDKGKTLKMISKIERESIHKIKIIEDKIYLLAKDGFLCISKDKAKTWEWIDTKVGKSLIDIDKLNNGKLLAIAGWQDPQIIMSDDDGKNWNKIYESQNVLYHIRQHQNKTFLIGLSNKILEILR